MRQLQQHIQRCQTGLGVQLQPVLELRDVNMSTTPATAISPAGGPGPPAAADSPTCPYSHSHCLVQAQNTGSGSGDGYTTSSTPAAGPDGTSDASHSGRIAAPRQQPHDV